MIVPFSEFASFAPFLTILAVGVIVGLALGLWRGHEQSKRIALAAFALGALSFVAGAAVENDALVRTGLFLSIAAAGAAGPALFRMKPVAIGFSLALGALAIIAAPSLLLLVTCMQGSCI